MTNITMMNTTGAIASVMWGMSETARDFVRDLSVSETCYVSDRVSEFADMNTSIYYTDIIKFISENVEAVNDTIDEYGWDECGGDLYKAGQMAEYNLIEREVCRYMEDILYVFALEYLEDEDITDIPCDFADDLAAFCAGNVDRFVQVTDFCDEWLKETADEEADEEAVSDADIA